jgi:hypothetical protein
VELALALTLGVLYLALIFILGVQTIQNGRWVLFVLGLFLPILWIVGAILPPRGRKGDGLTMTLGR